MVASQRMTRLGSWRCRFIVFLSCSLFPIQQTLPVDLSSSSVRSGGNGGASFHGSTSAFDPCCPGSASRPPPYVSQAIPGPSQPAVVDSFSSSVVAQPQPQTQPQPCRHYMHPSCECYGSMHNSNGAFSHFLLCGSKAFNGFLHPFSLLHRRPSSTLPASPALVCLSSFSWEPPAYVSAPSTGRLCHSPHCDLPSIPAIAPFWPHHDPCTSASAVYPPPLWFRCCSGAALAHGAPGPAASHTCTGGLSAEAPSTRDAAEDGGSEAQVDAASNVSIPFFSPTPSFKI